MKIIKFMTFIIIFVLLTAFAFLVDSFNFLARWLGHIDPYKGVLERGFYATLIFVFLWKCAGRWKGAVENLKVNAGDFGFEIKLGQDGNKDIKEIEVRTPVNLQSRRGDPYGKMQEIERKILKILGEEMNLDFDRDVSLQRGMYNYRADGFAMKNGRAYVVEVKVCDRKILLRRAISSLKTFAQGLKVQIKDTTVILCIYSAHPTSYFKDVVYAQTADLQMDFSYRVFSEEMLSKVE